jgi:hypothetical protein
MKTWNRYKVSNEISYSLFQIGGIIRKLLEKDYPSQGTR